ncbi:hypothetical protein IT575_13200 [bacterium]|nr:hypothetical protein [bacterium]
MDDNRRGNLAAIITLLLFLLGSAAFFGPGLYRSWLFQRSCDAMLTDALAGRLQQVSGYVQPQQKLLVDTLFQTAVPQNYTDYLHSLKLSSFEKDKTEPGVIWAMVTAKLSSSEGGSETAGMAQGKLRWVWNGRKWEWDFEGSYGSEFPVSGQANWVRLGDFITIEDH